jgi:hypothetical protein
MPDPEKVVFCIAENERGGTDVVLGLSEASWEYMKDGKTHTFDLTKLGLPIRIFLFGGPDREWCYQQLEAHNRRLGIETLDKRGDDFSVQGPPA